MSERDVRARLIESAFALFEERGYESTTVDQIADRAGVGRTTFFRTFRSKEDVIFPDHEAVLNSIAARLANSTQGMSFGVVPIDTWREARHSMCNHPKASRMEIAGGGRILPRGDFPFPRPFCFFRETGRKVEQR